MSAAEAKVPVELVWGEVRKRFADLPGKVVAGVPLFFTVALPLAAAALADLFRNQHVLNGAILVALVAVITALPLVAAAIALRSTDVPTLLMGLLAATAVIGLLCGMGTVPQGERLIAVAAIALALLGAWRVYRYARNQRQEALSTRAWLDFRAWITEPTRLLFCAATIPVILLNIPRFWPDGDYPAQFTRDVAMLGQLQDGVTELDFAERRRALEEPGAAAPVLTDQAAVRELFGALAALDARAVRRQVVTTDAVTALRDRALIVAANSPPPFDLSAFVQTTAMEQGRSVTVADSATARTQLTAADIKNRLALTYVATRWGAQRRWADGFRVMRVVGVIAILVGIAALIVAAWTATVPLARSVLAQTETGEDNGPSAQYAVRVQIILIAIVVELVIAVPMLRPIHPDEIRLDAPHEAFLQANWFLPRTVKGAVDDIRNDPHTTTLPMSPATVRSPGSLAPDTSAHATLGERLDSLGAVLDARLPTWSQNDWDNALTRLFGTLGTQ